MARFDLYALPRGGYVVDVQSDHVSSILRTRVVAPLLPAADLGTLISELNPVVAIGGNEHAFAAQSLATLTRTELGQRVSNLAEHRDAFTRALDVVLTGF